MLPGASWVLRAFWELSTERQSGFGAGPIPFSAVMRWAERYGPTDLDPFDDFLHLIREMDDVFLGKSSTATPDDKTAAAAKPAMSMKEMAGSLTAIRKR